MSPSFIDPSDKIFPILKKNKNTVSLCSYHTIITGIETLFDFRFLWDEGI